MKTISCRRSCEAMGTEFEALLFGDDEEHLEAVAVAALEEVRRLDETLSRFDPRSEISRINRDAGRNSIRVSREVFSLLEFCEQSRLDTDGFFDVLARTSGSLEQAGLILDSDACEIRLPTSDTTIDLGGVGKGVALDRAREILVRFNVGHGLLNGGSSSMTVIGSPPGGPDATVGWPIDLVNPLEPERPVIARIELTGKALSCSGVRSHNQQTSDLINPWTGEPLIGDAVCVALAPSATEAEIYSTALLAMGLDRTKEFLARIQKPALEVGWFSEMAGFCWLLKTDRHV